MVPDIHPVSHETSYVTFTLLAFASDIVTEWFILKSLPQSLVMLPILASVRVGPMVMNVWSAQYDPARSRLSQIFTFQWYVVPGDKAEPL